MPICMQWWCNRCSHSCFGSGVDTSTNMPDVLCYVNEPLKYHICIWFGITLACGSSWSLLFASRQHEKDLVKTRVNLEPTWANLWSKRLALLMLMMKHLSRACGPSQHCVMTLLSKPVCRNSWKKAWCMYVCTVCLCVLTIASQRMLAYAKVLTIASQRMLAYAKVLSCIYVSTYIHI